MLQSFLHGLPSAVNVILYHIYAMNRKTGSSNSVVCVILEAVVNVSDYTFVETRFIS